MRDVQHIKAFRLFDQALAENSGNTTFQLQDWERVHLQGCEECRGVLVVLARNLKGKPPGFFSARTPRFTIGDCITVTGPGPHRGKQGLVIEIIEGTADFVHRYRVRFSDGTSASFFVFEIELIDGIQPSGT